MRLIDNSRIGLPTGWEEQAAAARDQVAAADETKRAAAINARAEIWAQLKPALRALSSNKCWYCESKNLGSDNAVDHFRPKNSVKGTARFPHASPHPGYWWLAFDSTNYRFCCTFCNSIRKDGEGITGGKQDYFPLCDETRRAQRPGDDLDLELPALLDPTHAADVAALWFFENGQAVPRAREPGESEVGYERWKARAEESIRLYHLNHPDIREARAQRLQEIDRLAKEADKWLGRDGKSEYDQAIVHAEIGKRLKELWDALRPDAEYSAAVRCLLHGTSGSSPAAAAVLKLL